MSDKFMRKSRNFRYGFNLVFSSFQPLGNRFSHYIDDSMIRISKLCGVVGVAVQPAVIHHDIGGNRVQELFELQVIVIPYPVKWSVPVIDLAEADYTFPIQGKGMDSQVVLQCIVQRLMEKGGIGMLLFWEAGPEA